MKACKTSIRVSGGYVAVISSTLVALSLLAWSRSLSSAQNVVLGNFSLSGGTVTKEVSTGAINPGSKLVGQITNSSNVELDDVTFEVHKVGDNSSPPQHGGSTNVSNGNAHSEGSSENTNEGTKSNVQFGGTAGVPPMKVNATSNFSIPIDDPGTGQIVRVRITPSEKPGPGSEHADVLAGIAFTSAKIGGSSRLIAPYHDRGSLLLSNQEPRGSGGMSIFSFSGTCQLPSGVGLSSVTLLDPSNPPNTVSGAIIDLNGNAFTISNLSMQPGLTYKLVTIFTSAPSSAYMVTLQAEFAD